MTEFEDLAQSFDEVRFRLDDSVEDASEESLENLRTRIRNTLIARGMASGNERALGNPRDGRNVASGINYPLATNDAWVISQQGETWTMRPANPRVRQKAVIQEFGLDAANRATENMTFMTADGIRTVSPETMSARNNRYAGWYRQSVERWNNSNDNPRSVISSKIRSLMREVLRR